MASPACAIGFAFVGLNLHWFLHFLNRKQNLMAEHVDSGVDPLQAERDAILIQDAGFTVSEQLCNAADRASDAGHALQDSMFSRMEQR